MRKLLRALCGWDGAGHYDCCFSGHGRRPELLRSGRVSEVRILHAFTEQPSTARVRHLEALGRHWEARAARV